MARYDRADASPRALAASTPMRMNPAWLIEEYASIRLTSVWTTAPIEPTSSDSTASTQTIGRQSAEVEPSPV